MTAVIGTAAVAPLVAAASVRAEQVTQLVLGETASVLESAGEWLRVRCDIDGYEGWVHQGYVRRADDDAADRWRASAAGWSEEARLDVGGITRSLPLRSRVALAGGEAVLPDGSRGRLVGGAIRPLAAVVTAALAVPPERWALDHFGGTAYEWGGLTPWGVDCSGLVQTTFLARGLTVPRDSAEQAVFGDGVPLDAVQPGDLLFFRSESGSDRITHVAFAAEGGSLVHSTIACGGVVCEPFTAGSRAGEALRPRLVSARRFVARQVGR
jgi:hypothetical protein